MELSQPGDESRVLVIYTGMHIFPAFKMARSQR
jgi:hypothetical protein